MMTLPRVLVVMMLILTRSRLLKVSCRSILLSRSVLEAKLINRLRLELGLLLFSVMELNM